MYEIKDLEWEKKRVEGRIIYISANSIKHYSIRKSSRHTWKLRIDFREDRNLLFLTMKGAKQAANAHWRGILDPFLRGIK